MPKSLIASQEYVQWFAKVKKRIHTVRVKVAQAANRELLLFYWDLGKTITKKMTETKWGNKLLEQMAHDLKKEFSEIAGFSRRNLYYIKQFYRYFEGYEEDNEIVPRTGAQSNVKQIVQYIAENLSWSHIKLILDKKMDYNETLFYIHETIANGWSRDVFALQLKSDLYKRQGKAITNFDLLPSPQSDLAQQIIKDPYVFDFMTMTKPYNERDIENKLLQHITKFLLELGRGFAFVGRQYHLEVSSKNYYIDLLFYHTKLKCYVVVELKNTGFKPEYTGKLNFYLSAVDSLIKDEDDNSTIGILLCRNKDNVEAEFALRDLNKPMGISEFNLTEILPNELKGSLPTVEEIEADLQAMDRDEGPA